MNDSPSSRGQQMMIRRIFGIPILMKRQSKPAFGFGDWCWGRWRRTDPVDEIEVNLMLRNTTWKE